MARQLVVDFQGEVPQTVKKLETLAGVGHKTAQVVASVAFGVPTLAVDTHVYRVSQRIGLARDAKTPEHVERQLKALLPSSEWGDFHHYLILHGRYHCTARNPACVTCPLRSDCHYFKELQKIPSDRTGLDVRKGKYFCGTRSHYFDVADVISDRNEVPQQTCPKCGSMNIFESKNGRSTKKARDYRIN